MPPRSTQRRSMAVLLIALLAGCVNTPPGTGGSGRDITDPGPSQEERAEAAAADARLKVRQALHLDRWETWATGAGLAIAAGLGADPDRVCDLLDGQVRRHIERLQDELAA